MKTAILGGTFDPVHIGHLLMADEVLARLGYERVLFIPARVPPHKRDSPVASASSRVEMLRRAVADRDVFGVDTFEIDQAGVSYTVRTLRHLVASPEVTGKPGLIMGEDLVSGFDSWREADEVEALADLILVRRPVDDGVRFDRPHTLVENVLLEVSSTEIRERISGGLPYRYLVTPPVFEYIETKGLYRDTR
ncbi:MAG: nicotinate-nucleotide adenylyltransferase [Spirochaetota bacterium]